MQTRILKTSQPDIEIAAAILKKGGLVAFPTETVYGLGASALNTSAVKNIYSVKGRPMDNPLIAHVSDRQMVFSVAKSIPKQVDRLIEKFWPGPLTIILPIRDDIDRYFCAGLDSVAVRCPQHPVAHDIIAAAKEPIVAPSANLSGKPSPTCFEHVYDDLFGKVDAIVDGGDCEIGIESTVVLPNDKGVHILRPGAVTADMLKSAVQNVTIDKAILKPVQSGQKVLSPGMLHRHYAPKAKMVLLCGDNQKIYDYINAKIQISGIKAGVLCFENEVKYFSGAVVISYGKMDDAQSVSHNLFKALRDFDKNEVDVIYAHAPRPCGDTLGVYNRMLRAASFNVINL